MPKTPSANGLINAATPPQQPPIKMRSSHASGDANEFGKKFQEVVIEFLDKRHALRSVARSLLKPDIPEKVFESWWFGNHVPTEAEIIAVARRLKVDPDRLRVWRRVH